MRKLPPTIALALATCASAFFAATASGDSRVTVSTGYLRQDGGPADPAISTCSSSNTATGASRRQQNEPPIAIDPLDPSFIVASSNDYCGLPTLGDA